MSESEKHADVASMLSILPQLHGLVMSCADLKEHGFTKSQLLVFAALAHRGKLNMSRVASYLSSSKEQATRAVAQLVEEGYVYREHNEDNRTMVDIRLTDKGRVLLDGWRTDLLERLAARLDAGLTEAERGELAQSLRRVTELLDKAN